MSQVSPRKSENRKIRFLFVTASRKLVLHWFGIFVVLAATSTNAQQPKVGEPVSPVDSPINLLGGETLDDLFYTWMRDTTYEDPRQVFTMQDGILRVSGDALGGLITKRAYRDYHLIIEFKWGKKTLRSRKEAARDSGVLVHCTGPDGGLNGIWMASFEAQIIEGGFGDILVLTGKDPKTGKSIPMSLATEFTKDRDGEKVWKKGSERVTLSGGRINWWGRDPDWKDVVNFRGKQDVESPRGQWTRMDVICDRGYLLIQVNGVTVNEGFDAKPDYGRILLQTELAECFVRRFELWPLGKAPKFIND